MVGPGDTFFRCACQMTLEYCIVSVFGTSFIFAYLTQRKCLFQLPMSGAALYYRLEKPSKWPNASNYDTTAEKLSKT